MQRPSRPGPGLPVRYDAALAHRQRDDGVQRRPDLSCEWGAACVARRKDNRGW